MRDLLFKVEEQIDYHFIHPELLLLALTDESYDASACNRQLALLGDRTVSALVLKRLFEQYPNQPCAWYARVCALITTNEHFAAIARTIGLEHMLIGHRRQHYIALATGFEALVGAITIDRNEQHTSYFLERVYWPHTADQVKINAMYPRGDFRSALKHRCRSLGITTYMEKRTSNENGIRMHHVTVVELPSRIDLVNVSAKTESEAVSVSIMEALQALRNR